MATMPRKWTGSLKSTVLHVIALARFAVATAQAQLAGDRSFRPQRRREEIQLLREELRLVRARLASIDPLRRPRYAPVERMAILELRAARGWSTARTARRFLVSPATIAEWTRRVDEHGPDALVQLSRPINKFPDFVAHLVQRLKVHCPTLGKRKVAAMLARAGLHLGATTVARIFKGPPRPASPVGPKTPPDSKPRTVVAKRPNQVWHVDLTVVPTAAGLWCPWAPQAVPQCWPFCWWVAVVVDNYSRRVVGAATFLRQPSSVQTRAFLGKAMVHARARPKYLGSV